MEDETTSDGTVDVHTQDDILEALPTSINAQTSQVNVDAELAQQLAHEELFGEMLNNEDILRRELKRMYAWQKWRMSTLKVIGRTCSMMGEEKEWAMNWMGTRSIFDATRLDEIDRVFVEKLEGQLIKNGKGRELDTAFLNPREQEIEELIAVGKICNISRVQSSIRDTRLGVGTSRRTNVPEDCDQDEEAEDKQPMKDNSSCNKTVGPRANDEDDDESSDQSNHSSAHASKEDKPDDSSDSSSSNNSDDDNAGHGTPNHSQDEDETRKIEDEQMSNPAKES